MLKSLISNTRRQQFASLLIFHAAYIWFRSFSNVVLPPHYLQQGISLQQMIIGSIIVFMAASLLQIFKTHYASKRSFRLAIILTLVAVLLIIKITTVWQFYLSQAIFGLTIISFYLIYNIAHFELTPRHRTGFSSAIFFSIYPLVSLITSLLAGLLAQANYLFIWILSGLFFFIPQYLVKFQKDFKVSYNLKLSLQAIKATRSFIFLQGIWESLLFGIIPVFSLYFIKSPLSYGAYMAYLSLMSVLANLLLGRYTDRVQKRILFLYPLTLIMASLAFLFPLAISKVLWWVIITGAVQFLRPIFWNVSTAFVIDSHPNLRQAIPAREFLLSLGRVFGLSLVLLNFLVQSKPTYIFYFLGTIMLIYPFLLFYNTKISKKYSYL